MPDVPTSDPGQFYQGAPLLLVTDVSATADYYRKILGFQADPGADTPSWWCLGRTGTDRSLLDAVRDVHA